MSIASEITASLKQELLLRRFPQNPDALIGLKFQRKSILDKNFYKQCDRVLEIWHHTERDRQ